MLSQPQWLTFLGFALVAIYAFSRTGLPEISRFAVSSAVLLGCWALFKYGRIVNSGIMLRFVIVAIIFQSISWGLSLYVTPEWATDIPKLDKIIRWFIFIPLAWWLIQHKSFIWLTWLTAMLGIFLSPWITGEGFNDLLHGINGNRVNLGLRNAQHTSFFFGTIAIGLCCFIKPASKKHYLLLIPLLLSITYALLVVFISQTRQAWLAIIVTLLLFSIFFTLKYLKNSNLIRRVIILSIFCASFLTIGYLAATNERIIERVAVEKESLTAMINLDFEQIPYSSFGVRFHSWAAALEFIKEKPIFGWGSNGKTLVMQHTSWFPEIVKKRFGHLHNFYIEMIVNYGFVGILFYISIWVVIGRALFRQIKEGKIEKEIGFLFTSVLCFWSIINCFESYFNFWTGIFFFNVFMAGILAKIWRAKYITEQTRGPYISTLACSSLLSRIKLLGR